MLQTKKQIHPIYKTLQYIVLSVMQILIRYMILYNTPVRVQIYVTNKYKSLSIP